MQALNLREFRAPMNSRLEDRMPDFMKKIQYISMWNIEM